MNTPPTPPPINDPGSDAWLFALGVAAIVGLILYLAGVHSFH
jgi:hypothetical protein